MLIESGVVPFRSLPTELMRQLLRIENSAYPYEESPLIPAKVRLRMGVVEEAVLFVSDLVYFYLWDFDSSKAFVPVNQVAHIERSPLQMPPSVARRIYEFDETRMGSVTFELRMSDTKAFSCAFSSVAEFVRLPNPYRPEQIVDAVPQDRQPSASDLRNPGFVWCVYRADPQVVRSLAAHLENVPIDPEFYLLMRPEADLES